MANTISGLWASLGKPLWNGLNAILSIIGLVQVLNWSYDQTAAGQHRKLRREAAELFYRNRDLFTMTEYSFSIPAFIRMGPYHELGMQLREWAYYAIVPPVKSNQRDLLECISIMNRARNLIEKTLWDSEDSNCTKVYAQLRPRFDHLCTELSALRQKYPGHCPDSFKQAYLPDITPINALASHDSERTR